MEYEQHGNDRAKYGDWLLKRLAERVNKRGINETILKNCRRFYLAYPQIKDYLTAFSPTASEKSLGKSPTASDKSYVLKKNDFSYFSSSFLMVFRN